MDVCKTFAFISDTDEVSPHLIDTIFYEDRWWLVGTWLESNATGDRVPETLVLLDTLRHREIEGKPYRFALKPAIPISVLRGEAREGYVVATYQVLDDSRGPTGSRPQ